ncbi:thylakoid lumenal 16.5 kDa protein, chloroplastic [Phoenix dactylifera]|uniref:Thylakoid lumenal 16.5 kDa protein, chloroplastic n=1 Tax=Phoenix dactylifera TaxID=42345 RepID=A0A8B8ZK08_PHODC|nr:thylakoid lumenal 16.5 kDa protein, chloroplastic [Phoenix dactylifera]
MIRAWTPAASCAPPTPSTVTSKSKPIAKAPPPVPLSRRHGLSVGLTALTLSVLANPSRAAILEADDDEELLERVKKDRKKRLQRQGVISSSDKETGYLQELIYKLSKVGQAIENNNLSAASSVLGPSANADWLQNVNTAFTKLSSSPEEKIEVDTFNSSLASLFSSVGKRDIESSKLAFVSSATALEKWIGLTGLVGQLKGL